MLRSILLTDQSPHLTYDSAFSHYTTTDKSVTAHFANGTSATGSLLVGAEGIRSKVASQLVGEPASPTVMDIRCIYGKTPLTPDLDKELHATARKGANFLVDRKDGHQIVMVEETMRFHHPEAPQDYVFWAFAANKEVFGEVDFLHGSNAETSPANVVERLTAKWHPSLKCIVDHQDKSQTAHLPLRSSSTQGAVVWPTDRRVTTLGDAIHCMPPTGGQGANLAMRDAAVLGMALSQSEAHPEGGWSVETIRAYEDKMRYNVGEIVGLAVIAARRIFY